MNIVELERELRSSLESLETSLATPIVSGELSAWANQVGSAWADTRPRVRNQLVHAHQKQYEEITSQDPELFARVEKLKAEDAALEEQIESFNRLVDRLADLAPLAEPDERKFHALVEELQKRGVELITRMRRQLVAVQTWYQEAFIRDRGVAD